MRGGIFLLLILSVVNISGVPVTVEEISNVLEIQPDIIQGGAGSQAVAALNGVLFKSVIRYHCSLPQFADNSTTILYGSNGWTFPVQDVNLTLSYPTSNADVRKEYNFDYRVTGYQIIMFTDGSESTGYITSGGLLKAGITLNFNMNRVTMLSYEFWLYGVPADEVGTSNANQYQMC